MSGRYGYLDGELVELPDTGPLAPPPPARIREIRALAFLDRWPEGVFAGMLIQAMAGGDAPTVQNFLRLTTAQTINLDDPALAPQLAALVAAGALTPAQRDALLADGRPDEVP